MSCFHRSSTTKKKRYTVWQLTRQQFISQRWSRKVHGTQKKKHTLLPSVHALFLSPRTPHNEREIFNGGMRKTSLTQDKLRPKRQVTPTAARATARFPREVSCHSFFLLCLFLSSSFAHFPSSKASGSEKARWEKLPANAKIATVSSNINGNKYLPQG